MVMTLKEIRKNCKLTQKEAAEVVGMPLRTFVLYEGDEKSVDQIKLEGIKDRLLEYASKDTSILKDKVLLITGGTGSFGHAVVDRFLDTEIKEIRILSRDEKKQDDMRKAYNNSKLKFYIGFLIVWYETSICSQTVFISSTAFFTTFRLNSFHAG